MGEFTNALLLLVGRKAMMRFIPLVLSLCFVGTMTPLVQAYEIAHEGDHPADEPASETAKPTDVPTDTSADDDDDDNEEEESEPTETPEDTPTETPTQKPQSATTSPPTTLVGQCRLTNRPVSIFSEPSVSPDSTMLTTIASQTRVTLASDGKEGWIQISQPTAGHVIARYLTACPTESAATSEPRAFALHPTLANPTSGACRRAIEDLAIRSAPNRETSGLVGSVKEAQTMRLTGRSQIDGESRIWLRISQPRSGWVSGGIESWSNVEFCG